MFYDDAIATYQLIENHYSRFLRVVPLRHIASRLNIAPTTISRIQNSKQIKK